MKLTPRQRTTYLAHLYKAAFKSYHYQLAPLLERLCRACDQAESRQWLGGGSAAFAPHSLLERRVGGEQVHVLEWRRLICYLVRRERPGHGAFPPNSAG